MNWYKVICIQYVDYVLSLKIVVGEPTRELRKNQDRMVHIFFKNILR